MPKKTKRITLQRFQVRFYPNWVRGPSDQGTFHQPTAHLTEEFPTLLTAKHAAVQVLLDHNATNLGREWRTEIFRGLKRSVYGSERNLHVTWTRAY